MSPTGLLLAIIRVSDPVRDQSARKFANINVEAMPMKIFLLAEGNSLAYESYNMNCDMSEQF